MALVNDQSILMSIKKLLNVDEADDAFDTDIGMLINAEFMTLHQLGIGPAEGFSIDEADTVWADFSDDKTLINAVKTYIYMKVRLIFDPPASSVVADAFNARIHELEFRLNAQAERYNDDLVRTGYTGHDVYPDKVTDSGQTPKPDAGESDTTDSTDAPNGPNGNGLNGDTLDLTELIYGRSYSDPAGTSGADSNHN